MQNIPNIEETAETIMENIRNLNSTLKWQHLSVRNFLGTQIFLFPCSGLTNTGEIHLVVGDISSGKTMFFDALSNNIDNKFKKGGMSTSIVNNACYIGEINRYFMEEYTIMENIQFICEKYDLNINLNSEKEEMIKIFDLQNKNQKYFLNNIKAKHLSLFNKHILSLILANISQNKVFLLDNIFNMLTMEESVKMCKYLKKLSGTKIIMMTCNINDLNDVIVAYSTKYTLMYKLHVVYYGRNIRKYIKKIINDNLNLNNSENSNLNSNSENNLNNQNNNQSNTFNYSSLTNKNNNSLATSLQFLLSHTKNKEESTKQFTQRNTFLLNHIQSTSLNEDNDRLLLDIPRYSMLQCVKRTGLNCMKVFYGFKKINPIIYGITLILPEIIILLLSYLLSDRSVLMDMDIKIQTNKNYYSYQRNVYYKISGEELEDILSYVDKIKNDITMKNISIKGKELSQLMAFLSLIIYSKILTLFFVRYLFITQFYYCGYFFKNVIMGRNINCSILNNDVALIINVCMRMPNIFVEYLSNLYMFHKLLFLDWGVGLRLFFVHFLISLLLILYNLHLLRHTQNNFGLIFYKFMIFIVIYILYTIWRGLRSFLSQVLIYYILSDTERELMVVAALMIISIFLMKIGLFSN